MTKLSQQLSALVFSCAAMLGVNEDVLAQDHSHHDHQAMMQSADVSGIIKKSPIKDVSLAGTVDFNGKAIKDSDFKFKKRLIFFGFTQCPDVCPTGMATLSQAIGKIEKKFGSHFFDDTAIMLVSRDPKNDTPARMKEWLGHFSPKITGVTGKPERLQEIARNYRADQMGHHSPYLYIMDEGGRFEKLVNTQNGVDSVVKAFEESYGICTTPEPAKPAI